MITTRMIDYSKQIAEAMQTIDPTALESAYNKIADAVYFSRPVLIFGNGGSAAIAEHFACDLMKGLLNDTDIRVPAIALSSNPSVMTALSNDYAYRDVFSFQIDMYRNLKPLVIAISSSGKSPNILAGLQKAKQIQCDSVALVGFDGGPIIQAAFPDTVTVHVKANNYGIVEDCHSMIMHTIAQELRVSFCADDTVKLKL